MSRSQRAVRIEFVCVALAACVCVLPLCAQRIDELAVGPVRYEARALDRAGGSDSSRALCLSVARGGVIVEEARIGDITAPFTDVPMPAPERRCAEVGPVVTAFAGLIVVAGTVGGFIGSVANGGRVRDAVIRSVAIAVVVIGVAAVICNR